jgi:hypothetical protein
VLVVVSEWEDGVVQVLWRDYLALYEHFHIHAPVNVVARVAHVYLGLGPRASCNTCRCKDTGSLRQRIGLSFHRAPRDVDTFPVRIPYSASRVLRGLRDTVGCVSNSGF